jgi:nicotinate-nucleotide adenylyltransferase
MQIGVFGGSFDPPHLAHLALARRAVAELPLDLLLWVPAGQPWQKAGVSPARHRRAMLELMLAEAGEPRFALEPLELERSGPSYMVDTLTALQARPAWAGAQWWVLLGQDQYERLHTWHRFEALLPMAGWLVAARDGQSPPAPPLQKAQKSLEGAQAPEVLHAQAPAEAGAENPRCAPALWRVLEMPRMAVSSSALRQAVAEGQDASPWLSSSVARYIEQQQLYRMHDDPACADKPFKPAAPSPRFHPPAPGPIPNGTP